MIKFMREMVAYCNYCWQVMEGECIYIYIKFKPVFKIWKMLTSAVQY